MMKYEDDKKRIVCRLDLSDPTHKAVWDKIQNSGMSFQNYIMSALIAFNPNADAPVKATTNAELLEKIIEKIDAMQLMLQEMSIKQISDNDAKHTGQEAEVDASEETEETDEEEQELSPEDQAFLRSIGAWD